MWPVLDQNPFKLLEEAQGDFEQFSTSQDKNHKDKVPLNGGSTRGCHDVCE